MVQQLIELQNCSNTYTTYTQEINDTIIVTKKEMASKGTHHYNLRV